MAELVFFCGTMNGGKSTLALQMHHNRRGSGKHVVLITMHDRSDGSVSSRIGLAQPATVIDPDTDLYALVRDRLRRGEIVDELICDEAQFYTAEQVEQLARVVDDLDVEVSAFGLLVDFTSHLFAGSKRLVEIADERRAMQVEALCWCGARATHNARTVDGDIVYTGEQVLVGDVDGGEVAYEVLCRRHYRAGATRRSADRDPAESAAERAT